MNLKYCWLLRDALWADSRDGEIWLGMDLHLLEGNYCFACNWYELCPLFVIASSCFGCGVFLWAIVVWFWLIVNYWFGMLFGWWRCCLFVDKCLNILFGPLLTPWTPTLPQNFGFDWFSYVLGWLSFHFLLLLDPPC